jgi:hypothetical protein
VTLRSTLLRLPPKRIVGVDRRKNPGHAATFVFATEDYSWAGRVVRAGRVSQTPLLWTPEHAAMTHQMTLEEYLDSGLVDAMPSPRLAASPLRPPRAIVYHNGAIFPDGEIDFDESAAPIRSALASIRGELEGAGIFAGGVNAAVHSDDPADTGVVWLLTDFGPGLYGTELPEPTVDSITVADETLDVSREVYSLGSLAPKAGQVMSVFFSAFSTTSLVGEFLGEVFKLTNHINATIDYLRACAACGDLRFVRLGDDDSGAFSDVTISVCQEVAGAVPECRVHVNPTEADLVAEVREFFNL